ncbi:MAG TPA: hypothetical protein VI318_10360 [Baekduia sp.]
MPTDGTHREVQLPARKVTMSPAIASSSLTQPLARQQEAIMNLSHSVGMYARSIGEVHA